MTIEPSLIVWTVLCFLALMLILKKLLFQPMLTFMDARSEKIRAAREEKERAQSDREAEIRRLADERAAQEAERKAQNAAALESVQEELLRTAAEKRAESAQKLEAHRASLREESCRIRQTLTPELPGLALDLVTQLQKWQDDSHSVVDAEITAAPYADMDTLTHCTEEHTKEVSTNGTI